MQIDRSVWKAHENMPLKNVYLLFANLRCIRLFIISGDRLTGIISRSILFNVRVNERLALVVLYSDICYAGPSCFASGARQQIAYVWCFESILFCGGTGIDSTHGSGRGRPACT